MGYTSYNISTRSTSNARFAAENNLDFMEGASGVYLNMADDRTFKKVFAQQEKGEVHELMSPKGLKFRECRDSETHPNTVPIIIGLDVTASMGRVPKDFIMDGLPTMMTTIIGAGTPDAAVCFMATGDHVYDSGPVQVAQFESGDAELDMWLKRSWLEEGGGPNDGESYALPWYVAARHTKTDACEKRGVKGFLFTIGDEPILPSIPDSAIKAIFGDEEPIQATVTAEQALAEAKECYDVFHIALTNRGEKYWRKLLGQNYIPCDDYKKIPAMIAEIVAKRNNTSVTSVTTTVVDPTGSAPEML